ncbi:MAG: OmpA family protein [Desulfobacterales bacterium]|nr:OmpA family protein [Desulfobacterales bacterium]
MDEMDWLYLNMERIKDSERTVPYSFFVSIKEKKYNIRRLQKERSRYYKLVESYLEEMNSRILKEKKYSIQEKTIQEQKGKSEAEIQKNTYFEKLANETKRFESLLNRYSDLMEQKTIESKRMAEQKSSEKKESIQTKELVEAKPVQQTMMQENKKTISTVDKNQLYFEIQKAGLSDWIEITDSGTCLRLKTTLPILFPIGSAEIAKEYKSFFMRFANLLKAYEVQIMVQGYADIDPIHSKKYPSNFELGAIRAANVVHELVKNGLKPSIFKINSPGKYRFTANGESTQKAFERRAEVTVVFAG